jgi:hypothetical protein
LIRILQKWNMPSQEYHLRMASQPVNRSLVWMPCSLNDCRSLNNEACKLLYFSVWLQFCT